MDDLIIPRYDFQTVSSRHSVRSYLPVPIEESKINILNSLIAKLNDHSGLQLRLVTNEPDAFGKSLMARYGSFKNVANYIVVGAPEKTEQTQIDMGYYGEWVVLEAQKLGLNTCWVGLTFSRKNVKRHTGFGGYISCLIAVGYGATQGAQHPMKSPLRICPDYQRLNDQMRRGVDWAMLAPTALNQQKFRFRLLDNGSVEAFTLPGPYANVDLGIARLHFELGSRHK